MQLLSTNDFHKLIKTQSYPCISLYLDLAAPTSAQQSLHGTLHSQLLHIKQALAQICRESDRESLMKPLYDAAHALHSIPHDAEGVAMFRSMSTHGVFPTSVPVKDYVAISDTFHLKPILPMIQKQNIFYVVTLTQSTLTLFLGDSTGLKELKTYSIAGNEDGQRDLVAFQSPAKLGKFFSSWQYDIQRVIQQGEGPLVTVGSASLRRIFHEHCRIPLLLKDGINFRYSRGNLAVLHRKALEIVEPYFNSRSAVLANQYLALLARGKASNRIPDITEAIFSGRVAHILVSKDHYLYGRLDRQEGKVVNLRKNVDPIGDDILCDLAQEVILRGGKAHVLPQSMMPTPSPVAALFRW